jgi:hypothetical protein
LTDLPTNGLFAITIHAQITGNYSFTLTKNIYLNILPSTANYIFQSFPEQIYLDKNNIFVDPSKPVG